MLSLVRSKPKPVYKKKTPRTKSICVECGEIWRGVDATHGVDCGQTLSVITFRKGKTSKQVYEAALDNICRLLTIWRDDCVCVINDGYCNDVSHWGHVIPQGRNAFLVYELGNSFRQCAKHNELHRGVQYPYLEWYRTQWGNTASQMLEAARTKHKGGRNEYELARLLEKYVDLWLTRREMSRVEMVEAGYYGDIIKEAWIKDGKI